MGARRGGGPEGWGPEGVGWRGGPEPRKSGAAGVPHDNQRAQTCTFERPGLQKHHQNSTRKPPEREERKKFLAGEKKKERNFGRSRGRAVRREEVRGRGPKILNTPPHTQTTTPTSTNNKQPTTSNNQEQQATTRNHNNNRQFGQNIKTPKLAKCGLAKCSHENILAKFGFFWPNAVLDKCGFAKCGHDRCLVPTSAGSPIW